MWKPVTVATTQVTPPFGISCKINFLDVCKRTSTSRPCNTLISLLSRRKIAKAPRSRPFSPTDAHVDRLQRTIKTSFVSPFSSQPAYYSFANLIVLHNPRPIVTSKPRLDTLTVPPLQFQALFTLSSEFFSTFVHTTCSLSVLLSYLALDGIYHPFQTPLPKCLTL